MANYLLTNTPYINVGLGTLTYTVPATGNYNVALQCTEAVIPSGLSIVVNNNGSPIYTAPAITPTQSALQLKTSFEASLNDSITVVLSSSNANDSLLNSVKMNVAVGQGF